jgi:hypothetical protein
MHINKSRIASVLALAAAALFTASTGHAQATASGTLNVTATVTSSLQLLLESSTSPAGPVLTGSGTNNAILAFGNISAYGGNLATGVAMVSASDTTHCSSGNTCFVVSAPVNVVVNQFNGSSTKFTLTAELGTADASNFWAVGSEANVITKTSPTTIVNGAGTYGSGGNSETIYLGVPTSTGNGALISNSIDFIVTAN